MIKRLREWLRPGGRTGSPERVITGLGNPGHRYARTRHNAGFEVVERIAGKNGGWKDYRRLASICSVQIEGTEVMLVRPLTFMNLSGEAVKHLLSHWNLSPEDLLVIHDDLDLSVGSIRLRPGGGPGGHKGVKSIIDCLQCRSFARLRIGIGRPPAGEDTVEYVLEPFSLEERSKLEDIWELAADAARCWVKSGIETAMNHYNRRA
jgi:PTH1 family peptidyl-tRNA hydrolase